MGDVKLRLLADSFRQYRYTDDGDIDKKRGYKMVHQGEEFTVPDFVADRLLDERSHVVSPSGFHRPVAVKADAEEKEVAPVNEQASQFPEGDFGTTTVAGTLVADPDGELVKQRTEARTMERTVQKDNKRPAPQPAHKSEG